MKKTVKDLTALELKTTLEKLTQFYEFTFFGERGVDVSLGLTYALEYAVCSLGLVGDWLYEDADSYNTADMMEQFVMALSNEAARLSYTPWLNYCANMPYSRSLSA
jgi:hypothetical protein